MWQQNPGTKCKGIGISESAMATVIESLLNSAKEASAWVIVTDQQVAQLYLSFFINAWPLQAPVIIVLPPGESSKSRDSKSFIEDIMLANGCDRDSVMLALGGGVVGDITGFVAATYLRGIDWINIPTTLLAMVDSGHGGKTAINTPLVKNAIGAFWPPVATVTEPAFLYSLSPEQQINGVIEALKMFLTLDGDAVYEFERQYLDKAVADDHALKWLIEHSQALKKSVVTEDARDSGMRHVLNFGHTVAHAMEKLSGYQILHGFAVAYGILLESKVAQLLGFLSAVNFQQVENLLYRLPYWQTHCDNLISERLIEVMRSDKKNQSGSIAMVLLTGIGAVHVHSGRYSHGVDEAVIKQAIAIVSQEQCYERQ